MFKSHTAQHHANRRVPIGLFITIFLIVGTAIIVGIISTPSAMADPTFQEIEIETLTNQVQEGGSARIIIGLNTSFTPEGELGGTQATQIQQEGIRTVQNRVLSQLAGTNIRLHAQFKYIPFMAMTVDETALERLINSRDVNFIKEDSLSEASLASSIPVIGADTAWASGYSGSGQSVAILDTGVDKGHNFFSGGKIVSEACYSSTGFDASYGFYSSVCPGGALETTVSGSGVDCVTAAAGYPTAQDDCKHGTHVAGIAAGNDGGGPNIGVAKDTNLIAIQVFTLFTTLDGAFTFSSDQIKGLERVYELRNTFDIAAVNMSLGGSTLYSGNCDGSEPDRKAAIDNLRSAGIATIVATGNNSSTSGIAAPACISSSVSVGASYDWDTVTSFSNVAPIIDFLAPGYDITSSIPGTPTSIDSWPGTSMATPHVAGAWAVARSLDPNATVDEILTAFKNTGTLIDDTRPGGTVQDIPRINVDLAIDSLNQAPVAVNDGAATPLNTAVTINVLANDYDPENQTITLIDVDSPPGHGSASKGSPTSIQYTPTGGYSGADSFTYTIQDELNREATGTVSIIVDGKSVFLPTILKN